MESIFNKKPNHYTILVVGEDHEALVNDFSCEKVCEKHVLYRYDDAEKLKTYKVGSLKSLISTLTPGEKKYYHYLKELEHYQSIDAFDFYLELTDGMEYDEQTGDALSTENPKGKFKNAVCRQFELERFGREGVFSNPFKLKDGSVSYSCKVNDVDWEKTHMYNTHTYERVWDICVDGKLPQNDAEKNILECMGDRHSYFSMFTSKDDYVKYNCSFWTYGIIINGEYADIEHFRSASDWICGFYDMFIKPMLYFGKNERITVYEVTASC